MKTTTTPLQDIVSTQYTQWVYPEPILDLPAWLANNWQWFDPSHAHRLFWPNQDHRVGLDILIAGCGTNQAAVIAFTNPGSQVVAVDVSRESLGHQKFLKDKYGLKNLELHLLPIEEIATLGRDFDLIISTGVLHHMASPEVGMKALAGCLRPDGVAAIMLYAKYGRIGVDMMQAVFRDMGLDQSEHSVEVVKQVLASLAADHPVKSYMAIAPDLGFDAGLVDTFLHGRERNYSVKDCLDLVASADLVFQDLFFKAPYHASLMSQDPTQLAVSQLPKERQWSVMEQINFRNGCHFFTACRADRPESTYKIDFAQPQALDYIPSLRYRCSLNGQSLARNNWSMNLDPAQSALLQQMDGQRTIRQMASALAPTPLFQHLKASELDDYAIRQFKSFWQLDFLAMGMA
jgi:SAM-dependent methyltransferase